MNARLIIGVGGLTAIAILLTGCSSLATGSTSSPGKPLQLRLVTSSLEGTCSAPALTSDAPASACDRAGTTTYVLGKSLGTVTPTSVSLSKDQGPAHSVILQLDNADISTVSNVSQEAIDKHLAILLNGRVLTAPLIMNSMTTSPLTLAFGTATEAKQAATELSTSATP